ncbi:hypothetical protein QEN62_gp45 [Streptomyces phage AxeJC]|uniref:DNA-binding phage zinc finger domain-containing protein n=1 Tax=Streptomyces phage AxeJC TaxID=2926084 RepID=A0A9E7E5S5_9CAUD|nr:hypothetical protein QEN62_gp45 [Streptomyces phage AxeJC]URC17967.1 hypothetical protein SEA_AXEJC_45 [Streptomyces phage AxeJC]
MTSTPDAVAVASLDTHRLILTVPNDGPADVASNLPRNTVAEILRYVADQFGPASERGAAETIREQRDNIAFNHGDMVAALRDALLDPAQHTPASATTAAHVLLAAHIRQLAAAAREYATQRNTEMRAAGDRSRTAAVTGMNTIARLLDDRATLLDPQPEEQPAAPAVERTLTAAHAAALAVDCPACKSPAGQFCTSHNGTRQRRHDVHQARTKAHREQAGR